MATTSCCGGRGRITGSARACRRADHVRRAMSIADPVAGGRRWAKRPAMLWTVTPSRARPAAQRDTVVLPASDDLALALDIGGTKLAAGVVTGDGAVRSLVTTAARRQEGPA